MVKAKLALDKLAPKVEAANKAYDDLRLKLDEELVDAGLQSAGAICHKHRIAATLASRETVKISDRSVTLAYVKKHLPDLLTVNTQTFGAWLRNESPGHIRTHPDKVGCIIENIPQLQIRITALKG
jgi:hypothetical protein